MTSPLRETPMVRAEIKHGKSKQEGMRSQAGVYLQNPYHQDIINLGRYGKLLSV